MIQETLAPHSTTELAAAFLQAAVLLGVALVCTYLYVRYRRDYFALWAVAWLLYAVRLGSIIVFLLGENRAWLFWHQVLAGWTAIAFLAAAVAFSEPARWRKEYWWLAAFPLTWSYVAIYRLDNFMLAAGPAVLFLSAASAWTGVVLWRLHRRVRSFPAALTGAGFVFWSLHTLDYPFLRAQGAWDPWGYYLDIVFALWIGSGILLLVLDDQQRGLSVLSELSDDLQGELRERELLEALLARPMTLPAVTGSALYSMDDAEYRMGVGSCAEWPRRPATGTTIQALEHMRRTGLPEALPLVHDGGPTADSGHPFAVALPVFRKDRMEEALVVVADSRNPFAVLDTRFLVALGHQVGAALANADLHERLGVRTTELESLATRMVRQHEEERQRLSRELHDESAQVFAALKLQLGMVRESAHEDQLAALDRAEELVGSGIQSIRAAARDLRPSLLDDLGLVSALRALAADFQDSSGVSIEAELPADFEPIGPEAELALYRALQEGLSNVARHAEGASRVTVQLASSNGQIELELRDNGQVDSAAEPSPGMGIVGMRERIGRLGGEVALERRPERGTVLRVTLPRAGSPS